MKRPSDEERHKALHGLSRTLVANMVEGVSKGSRRLEISGAATRPSSSPTACAIAGLLAHDRVQTRPACRSRAEPTTVVVDGASKELVGQVAAEIRSFRKPEPYKGKGVKYQGEVVRRKAGKAGGK